MTSTTFFIIFIPILAIILLAVNLVLAPHNPYQEKDSVFECGFHSFLGQNRTQFSVSFFIFGLLFLLFDLEILLVYPYSVSSYTNDIYGLVVMMVFFVLLTLGFIFELGKNALTIESRQTSVKEGELSIPYAFSSRLASFISTHSFTSSIFYPERLAFFSKLEKASALGGIMLGKIKEMYTILANSTSTDLQGYPKFTFFNEWDKKENKAKAIFGYIWDVPQLFSDYLRILKDKCAPVLEWALSNPPKPHAFTSLPLQSGPGSSSNNGEGSSTPNEIVPDQGPNTEGMTPLEAYTANLTYVRAAIREQYPGLPEQIGDILAKETLRKITVREFARRWRDMENNSLLFISIPSILDIPIIGVCLRAFLYSIFSYVDVTILPSVLLILEPLLATYRIYKLPSRIMRIYSVLIKINNYVVNSKLVYSGILVSVVVGTFLLFTPEFSCDSAVSWGRYIEHPVCFKLQWGINYIWVIIPLLIGIVLLSSPFHKKLVWAKEMERKREEEGNRCSHSIVDRKNLTGDIDFQLYKRIKCSGNIPVMHGIDCVENGSVCLRCHTTFCYHNGCNCSH